MLGQFKNSPRLESAPKEIRRINGRVLLITKDGHEEYFDEVVIGAHADEALQILR